MLLMGDCQGGKEETVDKVVEFVITVRKGV